MSDAREDVDGLLSLLTGLGVHRVLQYAFTCGHRSVNDASCCTNTVRRSPGSQASLVAHVESAVCPNVTCSR
jgi:hypothetical protein